jgi:hypothetical protein
VKFKIVLRIMSLKDRTIPVFIYPHELTFYVDNQATHKQLLTLYNPYDFPVKYQVYANTTDKYLVVDPKGSIAAHAYVDLLIRHIAPIQSKCHSRDKFMITMQDATTNHVSVLSMTTLVVTCFVKAVRQEMCAGHTSTR